jgi:hypothetical protein
VEIDQAVLEAAAGAEESVGMKGLRAVALLGAGATGLLGLAGLAHADESEHGLSAPDYPWPHNGILSSYDHSSIRRGHQVNIIMSRFGILFFFPPFSPVAECSYSLAFCLSVNSEDGLEGS